jgi:hypothetical protein
MRRGSSNVFINAFLDLPQHVSASHCHLQAIVVSSEAAQAVCILDVNGLRPVQSGQFWRVRTIVFRQYTGGFLARPLATQGRP